MANQNRTPATALELFQELQTSPHSFDFFDAVRRLECAFRDRPRVGRSARPVEDPVRLAQEPSLAFAGSTLASFEPGAEGHPARLASNFLGVFGPNGPLPLHLSEYARERLHNEDDPTLSRFADVFHHRVLSLFYRAWAAAQPCTNFDRPDDDRFALYVGAFLGLGMSSLLRRDAMPDRAKLFFAGRLVAQSRPPEGLLAMLQSFFDVQVQLREFVGEWIELPEDCRCYLDTSQRTGTLGASATIGSRVWDCQQKFRIVMGPMRFSQYVRFLPGGASTRRLAAIVRNYVGFELDWDAQLLLSKEEVPRTILGQVGHVGWTTWLAARRPTEDADDLRVSASAAAESRSGPFGVAPPTVSE